MKKDRPDSVVTVEVSQRYKMRCVGKLLHANDLQDLITMQIRVTSYVNNICLCLPYKIRVQTYRTAISSQMKRHALERSGKWIVDIFLAGLISPPSPLRIATFIDQGARTPVRRLKVNWKSFLFHSAPKGLISLIILQ